jgi:hypothetical protein
MHDINWSTIEWIDAKIDRKISIIYPRVSERNTSCQQPVPLFSKLREDRLS